MKRDKVETSYSNLGFNLGLCCWSGNLMQIDLKLRDNPSLIKLDFEK